MDSEYAGRGLASAAVRVVVEGAHEELGLHRIEATTLLHNVGSQRVLLKTGFQRIGLVVRVSAPQSSDCHNSRANICTAAPRLFNSQDPTLARSGLAKPSGDASAK